MASKKKQQENGAELLSAERKMGTVEEYQFEPIRGYPMLHWSGKRPFQAPSTTPLS